ncbi:MAG TPA: TonB-dependent receptor [Vicinamibacterales bacterium]|nr:TonB-dependent receptor [Vicinamibacterales bacterium]
MERLTTAVSVAFVGVAAVVLTAVPAGAQGTGVSILRPADGLRPQVERLQARATTGTIIGTVIDEAGSGLRGAMVSALGVTLASTVTDEKGQFTLHQLPPGEYLLRAHMLGFAASTGLMVRVGGTTPFQRVQLRRLDGAVATTGTTPVVARPIIAAGFDLPRGTESTKGDAVDADGHPHDEASWRTRHLPRSILKDAAPIVVVADDETAAFAPTSSLFGRAMGSAANLATSLFTDFPFSGEVNILTTGAVAPGALLSATALPRGVAYLALSAPAPGGEWLIRGAMSEADLSSWIVAGSFASKPGGSHKYNLGLSYSTQDYQGGNPAALAAVTDGSRNVGELYAFDQWSLNSAIALDYGARFAHYDYLQAPGLLSPRFGVAVEAFPKTTVRATVAQRMVAPGAEEFLATNTPGPWLPPERTFAPLRDPAALDAFRAERARSFEAAVEREFGDTFTIAVGRFYQQVDDQLVTVFGLGLPGGPKSVGHYYVANAGAVEADGWLVRWSTPTSRRVYGSVQYSRTAAHWLTHNDTDLLGGSVPAVLRPDTEDLHDLTSSITADIRETATRVFVLYKMNNGFVGSANTPAGVGLDVRYGIQVNQALPVAFAGTKWEVLVGLRNLFRDPTDPASVYDELLVVRPPKRLVGGFLVRF